MFEHIDAYIRWARTRVDPPPIERRSEKTYRSKLRQFQTWSAAREVTPQLLNEYREYLQFERPGVHGGPGQKPRTIKQAFQALIGFFDWLGEQGHASGLPDPRRTKRPRISKHDHGDTRPPEDEEVEALFRAANSFPGYTVNERFLRARACFILSIAADTAFRRFEILGLDRTDLRTSTVPWMLVCRDGKGSEYRRIELNERASGYARQYLAALDLWQVEVPARRGNPALFPRDRTRRINRDTLQRLRWQLLEMAGLPRMRLHDFRHYRISAWLSCGINPATAAEMAGHADSATTLTYDRAHAKERKKALEQSPGGSRAGGKRPNERQLRRRGPGHATRRTAP